MIDNSQFWNQYKSCEVYDIKDLPIEMQKNVELANQDRKKAYAPYSNYSVGAVIVTKSGKQISSANTETCNYDSVCAEAGAIAEWTKSSFSSSTENHPEREEISYVVVVGKPIESRTLRNDVFVTPCGRCRQRLYEHCYGNTTIVGCNETVDKARLYKLSDLLPFAFTPMNLK
jgi:cytidine deaminase